MRVYAGACYFLFLGVFWYLVGFVNSSHIHLFGDAYFVPRALDFGGRASSVGEAVAVDVGLLALFALQHSGMARRGFKAFWTHVVVPKPIERSTYVLFSSCCLMALFVFWRPITPVVWAVEGRALSGTIRAVGALGWLVVLVSASLINHQELFGLQQVRSHAIGAAAGPVKFQSPSLYKVVRHPMYVGFIIAFWASPEMTYGHFLFAATLVVYIAFAVRLEERDLIRDFGDEYREYQRRVRRLLPLPMPKRVQRELASGKVQRELAERKDES